MRKLIVSEWMSLDGVFDAEKMGQWFEPYHSDSRAEHIQGNILGADAFLMGRETYNTLAPYWSSLQNNEMGIAGRMNEAPKYVVSSTLAEAGWQNSTIINDPARVVAEVTRLKQQPGQNILLPGSASLVHSLLGTGLIDEIRFLVHPVIVGSGKRFFKDGLPTTRLELVNSQPLELGVMLLTYRPVE